MAVLIATSLRKEFSGDPLFEGVSFTVGRRDRLSLAGANGAGKTTLLRAIAGETSLQGGELALTKGARIALHDQRPPRDLGLTLREYALSGARTCSRSSPSFAASRRRWRAARTTRRRFAAMPTRRRSSSTAAAGPGATGSRRGPRARLRRGGSRPEAGHVLGRRADARVARTRACRQSRPAAARRAHESPRRREPGMARARAGDARRRGDPRGARPLVPRVRHHRRPRARAGRRPLLRRPVARVAAEKAERAAAAARTAERVSVDIVRLERFVERFRYKKSKAKQAQAKLTQIGRLEKERGRAAGEHESLTRRRQRLSASTSSLRRAPDASSWRQRASRSAQATSYCSRTRASPSSAARRSPSSDRTEAARRR